MPNISIQSPTDSVRSSFTELSDIIHCASFAGLDETHVVFLPLQVCALVVPATFGSADITVNASSVRFSLSVNDELAAQVNM